MLFNQFQLVLWQMEQVAMYRVWLFYLSIVSGVCAATGVRPMSPSQRAKGAGHGVLGIAVVSLVVFGAWAVIRLIG